MHLCFSHAIASLFCVVHRTRMGLISAAVVAIAGGAVVATGGWGISVVGPLLGFSSGGVVAGSTAAAAQSYAGNVAAGSIFAKVTSLAMVSPAPLVGGAFGAILSFCIIIIRTAFMFLVPNYVYKMYQSNKGTFSLRNIRWDCMEKSAN